MTIVLAEPFKSEIISRQTLGRTRDPNTMYIELVDMGFKYIRKFYFNKLPIFNKYASNVSDTTIDQYELDKRAYNILQERIKVEESPIELDDKRFNFNSVLPKKKDEISTGITQPIIFVDKNNIEL